MLESFSCQRRLVVVYWNLTDTKSPQVAWTFLADPNNAVVCRFSILPLIPNSSSRIFHPLRIVPKEPATTRVTQWTMLNIKISNNNNNNDNTRHLEYEKVFYSDCYTSNCPMQTRGERNRSLNGLWANLACSYKEAPPRPNLSLCVSNINRLNPQKKISYISIIIASASHIRTRVINFYLPTLVDKPWFVFLSIFCFSQRYFDVRC